MKKAPDFPLRVFYDGACSVCSREIDYYRRKDGGKRLVCIDISAPGFEPGLYDIPLEDFMYQLHAIDRRGTVYRGVDTFCAIWQAFPSSTLFVLLGTILQWPGVHRIARICYKGFARVRPFLPKNRKTARAARAAWGRGKNAAPPGERMLYNMHPAGGTFSITRPGADRLFFYVPGIGGNG